MDADSKPKKGHKKRQSGVKAKKKKEKLTGKVDRHNPRAFTFSGGVQSVARRVRYALEKKAKKERAPRINKTPEVPAPFVVVVQGPPGVGKTTLIQSLVKHWARQKLMQMGGPVTVVSGRFRRVTIVECPQNMAAMLDLAKVADLALLLIDASFGFELETFEFINIMQVHGFPRVIGVLTHLDSFKDNKALKKRKKAMKHRFWAELFGGAKLFHLSGLQHGRYHHLEVQNLARFISTSKLPILSWRQSHPYMLALRWEDQTDPAAPREAPRRLDLYGYVCGSRLREGTQVHLAGVGDFAITAIKALPDPCPPPEVIEAERTGSKSNKPKKKNVLRTLADRHRVVYAPGSAVGSISLDGDAMYIHLPEVEVGFTKRDGEGGGEVPEAVRMVRDLQKNGVASPMAGRPGLRLLGASATTLPEAQPAEPEPQPARTRRAVPEEGDSVPLDAGEAEEADDEGEEEEDPEAGDEVVEDNEEPDGIIEAARKRFAKAEKLEDAIYGSAGGSAAAAAQGPGAEPLPTDHTTLPLFDEEGEEAEEGQQKRSFDGLLGNLGDLDGVDTLRIPKLPMAVDVLDEDAKAALKERKFITGGWSSAEEEEDGEGGKKTEKPAKEAEKEAAAPGPEGGAAALEGFTDSVPIAAFVRVRLDDVPAACVEELRHERPLVLGGLLPGESHVGLVQMRVKRHRWHPKLLKSSDALLLSVGWRRFQTVPTFSIEDRGEKRMRFLKYTLEHAHCTMTSYGPMMPPNTGVLAFRKWDKVGHFRICATGSVLESAPNFRILKKLKLVGEPYKVFKNTAFIRNMFNSDLEVSKYMHSKVQTVSGIRGEVKKAEGRQGCFRATFEDRILSSDIVVCKCWVDVEPKQFYHPVIDVPEWRPARLIGELRAEKGIPVPDNRDSQYGKQLVRPERRFNPLRIPKNLQKALPYNALVEQPRAVSKEARELEKQTAVVSSDRELAVNDLLRRLSTVREAKDKIKTEVRAEKKKVKDARERFIQDKRDVHTRENKKARYKEEGQRLQLKRKKMRLE